LNGGRHHDNKLSKNRIDLGGKKSIKGPHKTCEGADGPHSPEGRSQLKELSGLELKIYREGCEKRPTRKKKTSISSWSRSARQPKRGAQPGKFRMSVGRNFPEGGE